MDLAAASTRTTLQAWRARLSRAILAGALSASASAVDITVDASTAYQTIDGFGSCCSHWTAAKWLADPAVRAAYVDDLRCSILRFPIPNDLLPKTENADDISAKNFKLSVGDGQVLDFVQAIKTHDPAIKVFGTAWSPPAWMKSNGKLAGGSLAKGKEVLLAKYLAELCTYLDAVRHVHIYAISPQNELIFSEPYDSCTYNPKDFCLTVAAIGKAFEAAHIDATLLGPEDMTDAAGRVMGFVNAIEADPEAKKHFGIVASHGYVDGVLSAGSADGHNALWNAVKPTHLPLWMTETSGERQSWAPLDKNGKPVIGALGLAMKIHNALVYGHVSAWVYWCFVGDNKISASAIGESLMNGTTPSDKYYASKQFYRWIRPGSQRIEAGPDNQESVSVSAYLHAPHQLTVVLINNAPAERAVHLTLKEVSAGSHLHAWRSTASEHCAAQPDLAVASGATSLTLPPQSVVTLTTYAEKDIEAPAAAH